MGSGEKQNRYEENLFQSIGGDGLHRLFDRRFGEFEEGWIDMPIRFDGLHVCHEGSQLVCAGGFPRSVADDEYGAVFIGGVFWVGGRNWVQRIDPCLRWFRGFGWIARLGWF